AERQGGVRPDGRAEAVRGARERGPRDRRGEDVTVPTACGVAPARAGATPQAAEPEVSHERRSLVRGGGGGRARGGGVVRPGSEEGQQATRRRRQFFGSTPVACPG